MPVENVLKAQWLGKCPRCREGDIFKYPLTNVSKFAAMNDRCPKCDASFNPEPGFYFGAMFVSYAFSVAIFIIVGVFLYVFFRPDDWTYLISITVAAIVFTPFSFRYSRILFLYWFGGYRYRP
jgi:uncharacterized protein (DUF983 family)